jgi:hypothetical protein
VCSYGQSNPCFSSSAKVLSVWRCPPRKKGAQLFERIVEQGQVVIHQLGASRAEQVGYYRFLENEQVTPKTLIESLGASCQQGVSKEHVLSISDTSEINLEAHRNRLKAKGRGVVGNNQDLGLFIHPALVINADDGLVLGISGLKLWNRAEGAPNKEERNYRNQPIEAKESYKWIEVFEQSQKTLAGTPARLITHIGDREADIYEEFSRVANETNHLLVRLSRDRRIVDSSDRLFDYLAGQPLAASYQLEIEADPRRHRQARLAEIEVRFCQVEIRRPKTLSRDYPPTLTLYAIEAREINPPAGEKPVLWRLLTTHEITTFAQAQQCILWYSWRWRIEQLFAILKTSGLQVESTELESFEAIQRLIVLALGAAVRILQLTMGRKDETHSAEIVFSPEELEYLALIAPSLNGATHKQQNPYQLGSLAWAAWLIARLGGWSGYQSQRPPGITTLSNGLRRFEMMFWGWSLTLS